MSIEYGLPASITGPCLVTVCGMSTTVGTSICGSSVNLCEAGSISFVNPADSTSKSQDCSYIFSDDSNGAVASCELQPLSGQVKGSGNSWSLYDSSSTIKLERIIATQSSVTVGTMLFVSTTSVLSHFITDGAAAATAVPASSTTVDLGSASGLTSIRATNTASPRTSTSSSSGSATPTSSESGQNRLHTSKAKVLGVAGILMMVLATL
ncbi:hypothetical protein PVAG01_11406 [Phlyctema vagabunda]|uniref:Uncharacterized protein n=1 Tax=Phlyctema vagabunda TaxID=108571 RepID=A0ABR4P267_9HELO